MAEGMDYDIMSERLNWAIERVKNDCSVNKVEFNEHMLSQAFEIARTMFVRKMFGIQTKK
jgi:hypothetical protein